MKDGGDGSQTPAEADSFLNMARMTGKGTSVTNVRDDRDVRDVRDDRDGQPAEQWSTHLAQAPRTEGCQTVS